MFTPAFTTLADHCLEIAAGMPVDAKAYGKYEGLNLARVQRLGRGYREGWLANVLRRITPLTARSREDYLIMADLFLTTQPDAEALLKRMSGDLTAFATAAGLYATAQSIPAEMRDHVALYRAIACLLEQKFDFTAPAPFASATVDAGLQAQIPFIRNFMQSRAA